MDDFGLSRRQLLASGLVAGVTTTAGCLGLGSDTVTTDAQTALVLSLTRVEGPLRNRFVNKRTAPSDYWDEQAIDAALNDEHYTIQYRKPFFASPEDPAYVVHNGTYYQLGSVIVDEATETHPVLRLFESEDAAATPVDGGEDGALPEPDQRAVYIAHLAARARGNEGGFPSELVQRGGYVYRSETARNGSSLLGENGPDYVTYRDTTYRVAVTTERFHEPVYRPTARPVAETPEQMEAILRATFVGPRVSEADLSTEAREIVIGARADGYSEAYPFSDAYKELLRALDKRAYIDGNIRKDAGVREDHKRMLQYEGRYYEYALRITGSPDN